MDGLNPFGIIFYFSFFGINAALSGHPKGVRFECLVLPAAEWGVNQARAAQRNGWNHAGFKRQQSVASRRLAEAGFSRLTNSVISLPPFGLQFYMLYHHGRAVCI
jgi:hypothetical protein